ncbi:MAG: HlyD family efflux transporter periplasmic adaptor subunit [Campylobacterota bacterium]|nr:HlyD family efflux transporter periplasmic adaptor subunit [Campylobacterota bacterium]
MLKKYGLVSVITILLAMSVLFIYKKINPQTLPDNLISGMGRLDGDIILLNTKYPGRIQEILVEDSQEIKKGEVVASLQSDEYQAKLRAINRSINSAKDGLIAMEYEYDIAKESIPIEIKRASEAVEISISQKNELNDSISSLKEVVEQDKRDYTRTEALYKKELIGKQKLELVKLKLLSDTNQLSGLKQKKVQLEKSIIIAKDTVKLAQTQKKKLLSIRANINATQNKIEALKANREELKIIISQLTIKSPIDGVVIEKVANVGEVIGSGMIVATLIEPSSLYLKMFVDTLENGKITIGNKAVIFLDSNPNIAIDAKVVKIAQKAEFTPKEVNVKSDRIQHMYAVHIKPIKTNKLFKIGLPAIGVISVDDMGLPSNLNEIPEI